MFDPRLEVNFKNSHDTDAQLWKKFKSGDLISYELIYRNNVRDLFNYGISIIPEEAVIQDCIHELFLEIWKSRKNLSDTDNIKYYLLKSLRWKINHFNSQAQKTQAVDFQTNIYDKQISFPFEDEIIRKQQIVANKNKIERALAKLTPRQKEIITLIFYEGLTYEEIASLMSLNVGSIYTLAWKAISHLKKLV
ncbi:MAG: sigma-70 family RNA polymerase sigma factor [Cyclobacteriaceae bacterium]